MSFSPRERLEQFHQGMEKAKQEMPKTSKAFSTSQERLKAKARSQDEKRN